MEQTNFKDKEIFNNIRVTTPFIARLDGWAFHTFTKGMRKPFDDRLSVRFLDAAREFFKAFNPSLAYYFSDEISFIFFEPTVFDRIEKLDSLMPSHFASSFSELGSKASFDCRIVPMVDDADVTKYLIWRQAECKRNFLNAWAEAMVLRVDNLSPAKTASTLKGLNGNQLKEVCKERGFDTDYAPLWQQNGVILKSEYYLKKGYNPITDEKVLAERRYTNANYNVPNFISEEGVEYLNMLFYSIKTPVVHNIYKHTHTYQL
jgi:tRNA(His) 5'-end guanylyltransferase